MFATTLQSLIVTRTSILATTLLTFAITIKSSIKKEHKRLILNFKKQNQIVESLLKMFKI